MKKNLKGSFKLLKQMNVSTILKNIREHGAISRAEIAELTGLTPASVSKITEELIEKEVVYEAGVGESNGGRPPILLKFNPEFSYIIGVNLGPERIEVVVTDLKANILASSSKEIKKSDKDYIINNLFDSISQAINKSEVTKDKLLGIGMAVHGIVNSNTGISLYAPHYHWKQVPIKELVEEKFNLPTFIDNDVRAMALGEKCFGRAQDSDNFIIINVSDGIGSGIMIDGNLYQGSDYSAGEIGHISVDDNGPKCSCGNYGCLESLASNPRLIKQAEKVIKQGAETKIYQLADNNLDGITVTIICRAAEQKDEVAQQILKQAGRYLGIAISYLINILDPKLIILAGEVIEGRKYLFPSIKEVIKNKALKLPAKNVEICSTTLPGRAASIGGVTLVFERLLDETEALRGG